MSNKKETTAYYQNIIKTIETHVLTLESEAKERGFLPRWFINRKIRNAKSQLNYYRALLDEYKKRKLAK
tara:strand:- start:500 stop:706 length:207 start_codon:yes stop_codon:yes gene_type:complete